MKHKWGKTYTNCERCGLERKKELAVTGTRSILKRSGIFEDVPTYSDYPVWQYFVDGYWTIYRPDCKNIQP
jgi:hypothetical protein